MKLLYIFISLVARDNPKIIFFNVEIKGYKGKIHDTLKKRSFGSPTWKDAKGILVTAT